jgi:dynein heavy chain
MLKAPLRPREEPKRKPEDPANKKFLPDENIWLWDAFYAIRSSLEQSIVPLYEYVQTFSKFEGENKLNPDKFVKSLDEGDQPITAEGLKNDIMEHRKEEDRLRNEIPEFVTVSIFQINCKDIRNMYVGKHSNIIEKEIKLISQKAKEMNYNLSTKFDEINERIRRPPKNIEELTETKKYISEIPVTIAKLREEINQCMDIYNILDDFNFEFSGSDLDQKWTLFGAPQKIIGVIEAQSQILEKQREAFVKGMEAEQEEFEETLDNLEITVGGFAAFDDLNRYEEISVDVESVNQRI